MNHLIAVSMPRNGYTQTRTFNYNVNGTVVTAFLQSATNPETGTVSYTYNSNNTLASKTDAKNQNFTYAYDTYNRLTTISVNSTLLRTFIYDTNTLDNTGFSQNTLGRLAAVEYIPPIPRASSQRHVQLRCSRDGGSRSPHEKAAPGKPAPCAGPP
jgi:YD repeat-containing protein